MKGILFSASVILILVISVWVYYLVVYKKLPAQQIAMRMAVVAVLFIFFLFIDTIILFVTFWGDRREMKEHIPRDYFHVVNNSSVPLLMDASFAYTREEMDGLIQRNIFIDPMSNFVIYRNVYLPLAGTGSMNTYYFELPASPDAADIELSRDLYLILCDTTGTEMLRIDREYVYSNVSRVERSFYWEITDSLINHKKK